MSEAPSLAATAATCASGNLSSSLARSTFVDDFNYPTAQRGDTMYLRSYDSPKVHHARAKPTGLTTLDIPGAQAGTLGSPLKCLKPKHFDGSLKASDIPGARPKRLIPLQPLSSEKFYLNNRDIAGSYARGVNPSQRHTDPNVPKYHLPNVTHRPVTPPPQMSESLKIEDIPGTKPHHKIVLTKPTRNVLQVEDIPRACADTTLSARRRQQGKDRPVDNPTAEFRTVEELGLKTSRVTNPLSPRYRWDASVLPEAVGTIPGAHPRPIPRERSDQTKLLSLRCHDIPGAQPRLKIPKPGNVRREIRNPVDISDIPAAHPTKIHCQFYHTKDGKISERCVNPVVPEYKPLGWRKKEPSAPPPLSL